MQVATFYKQDYSGGLNSTAAIRDVAQNEATVLQNWDITYQGQLKRRDGLTLVGSLSPNVPVMGLGAFVRDSGADLLSLMGPNLGYLNGSSWGILSNTIVTGNKLWMENVQSLGRIYLANQDNTLKYWDRTNTTLNSALVDLGSTVPHGNVMIWYKNFLFHLNKVQVGTTTYNEDIFWSNMGDPDTYDTTNNHTTVPGDGQLITAAPLGDDLILFKERSIQHLSGWGDSSWQITGSTSSYASISEEVGCIAPRGAVQVGNEVWFMDNQARIRRVLQTDFDAFRHDVISVKIQGTLDGMNKAQLSQTVAWSWNDKVYFAIPYGSDITNSLVLVFDLIASKRLTPNAYMYVSEAWTTYTGWNTSCAVTYPTNESLDLYLGDAQTGAVYKHTGVDDNGIAIDAIFEDGNTDYGLPEQYKNYKFGYMEAQAGTGDTNVYVDASMDTAPYVNAGVLNLLAVGSTVGPTGNARCGPTGSARCGGSVYNSVRFTYDQNGQSPISKRIRHKIWHNSPGQQPIVNAFTSYYKPRVQR